MPVGLAILVALIGLHLVGTCIAARMILRPKRLTLAKAAEFYEVASPADFGRRYGPFEVPADEVVIRGWLVRAEPASDRTVILIHGIGDNRVGVLSLLPVVGPLGANVALIDLRSHGESGGRFVTYGARERRDLSAVIDWLVEHGLARPGGVALVGLSLGGAISIQTAAEDARVAAVVADGAFADLRQVIYARARQIFLPGVTLVPMGLRLAERRAGFSARAVSPLGVAARVRCPVLLIHGDDDPLISSEQAQALAAAFDGRADLWRLADVGHCGALAADEAAYTRRVRGFLAGVWGLGSGV
jgi:pimeloyl-ACP methyl ester carboxylesterase